MTRTLVFLLGLILPFINAKCSDPSSWFSKILIWYFLSLITILSVFLSLTNLTISELKKQYLSNHKYHYMLLLAGKLKESEKKLKNKLGIEKIKVVYFD